MTDEPSKWFVGQKVWTKFTGDGEITMVNEHVVKVVGKTGKVSYVPRARRTDLQIIESKDFHGG